MLRLVCVHFEELFTGVRIFDRCVPLGTVWRWKPGTIVARFNWRDGPKRIRTWSERSGVAMELCLHLKRFWFVSVYLVVRFEVQSKPEKSLYNYPVSHPRVPHKEHPGGNCITSGYGWEISRKHSRTREISGFLTRGCLLGIPMG